MPMFGACKTVERGVDSRLNRGCSRWTRTNCKFGWRERFLVPVPPPTPSKFAVSPGSATCYHWIEKCWRFYHYHWCLLGRVWVKYIAFKISCECCPLHFCVKNFCWFCIEEKKICTWAYLSKKMRSFTKQDRKNYTEETYKNRDE